MFSVLPRKPAPGHSARAATGPRPQAAPGSRLIWPTSLLVAALGLAGCAHTNSDMAASGKAPRAAHAHTAYAPKAHAAKFRAIRNNADARADVTSTVKPAKPITPGAIPLPDEALLKRQPPPDCELRTQPAGGTPTEVKLATYDFERQCYRQVEGIVRGRLDALQDAVGETIKAVKSRQGSGQGHIQAQGN